MKLSRLIRTTPRTTCRAVYADEPAPAGFPEGSTAWAVTLRRAGRRLTVPFYQGPAVCEEPDAAGVLSCLLLDASSVDQDFESWCGDYGYDPDSRRAEKLYRACQSIRTKLEKFLGDDFEAFLYAENDV